MSFRLFIPALLLTLSLPAQQRVYVPDGSASTGKQNIIPLGGKGPTGAFQDMRVQIRVPSSYLPSTGSTIKDLGFTSAGTGTYSYKTFIVNIAHLKSTTMSATFADNLAGPVQVLNKSGFKFSFPKADQFTFLGLQGSFQHDGKRDLVIEIIIQGAFFGGNDPGSRRSDVLETVYALRYSLTQPSKVGYGPFKQGAKLALELFGQSIVYYGKGCQGSGGKVPSIKLDRQPKTGASFTMSLSGGNPSSLGVLFIGNDDKKFGALTLPFGLDALGAKGCSLLTDILLPLPGTTSSTGTLAFTIPVPRESRLSGLRLLGQWVVADPKANAFGFVFSQGVRSSIQ